MHAWSQHQHPPHAPPFSFIATNLRPGVLMPPFQPVCVGCRLPAGRGEAGGLAQGEGVARHEAAEIVLARQRMLEGGPQGPGYASRLGLDLEDGRRETSRGHGTDPLGQGRVQFAAQDRFLARTGLDLEAIECCQGPELENARCDASGREGLGQRFPGHARLSLVGPDPSPRLCHSRSHLGLVDKRLLPHILAGHRSKRPRDAAVRVARMPLEGCVE
jgi:hypothetical protein